ncbi:MAG: NAD-dependent malic enzyme [Myxococcales bacterium]|nr:NAD-dependent malic enzyme [Myxococcales bacterium]
MATNFVQARDGSLVVKTDKRGIDILSDPLLNKGTGFSAEERRTLKIEGLLPKAVAEIGAQVKRALDNIARKSPDLEKYIGMISLQDRNETLFYRLLQDHIEELMPIVYTPTVGEACTSFSQIFRRGRGVWITPDDRGRIDEVLANADNGSIRLIVVTDGERILGLGDQGAGGMGIPIGKLSLYTAAAGIHPRHCLPICLDVGTDNQTLLDDPEYVGVREARLRGEPYQSFVAEFIEAVKHRFPRALLQWEDFKKNNAIELLARYRKDLASFNDDIQGTAAVGLAAVLAAGRKTGTPIDQQRVVILGAGAAGVGIAHQLRDAMHRAGLSEEALIRAIALIDSRGMLVDSREISDEFKRVFAWPDKLARACGLDPGKTIDLLKVVDALEPTILIGTSGQAGAFTEEVVRAVHKGCSEPAIFPFSNPTSKCEAAPADIIRWTGGHALVATGSPFPMVEYEGRSFRIGQSNNVFVFPGVGLACLVGDVREVTDSMFTIAAEIVAESVEKQDLDEGTLFPRLTTLREITHRIACAVIREANDLGLGNEIPDGEIKNRVSQMMWEPAYPKIEAE